MIPLIILKDTVIWFGDFNYRIGLGSEKVKHLIKMGDLETLYENDQVPASSLHLRGRLLILLVEPSDGRWLDVSLLFRSQNYVQSNVQI